MGLNLEQLLSKDKIFQNLIRPKEKSVILEDKIMNVIKLKKYIQFQYFLFFYTHKLF